MGTLCLIIEIPSFRYIPSFSAQKGNFLRPAAKEGIAILFTDTSPRGAGIEGEDDDYDFGTGVAMSIVMKPAQNLTSSPYKFIGAGFYLDATNPKYALYYNMRTHIQFEIPQVLEISGLPIVKLCHLFLSPT